MRSGRVGRGVLFGTEMIFVAGYLGGCGCETVQPQVGRIFEDGPLGPGGGMCAYPVVGCSKNGIRAGEFAVRSGDSEGGMALAAPFRTAMHGGLSSAKVPGECESAETFIGGMVATLTLQGNACYRRQRHEGKVAVLGYLSRGGRDFGGCAESQEARVVSREKGRGEAALRCSPGAFPRLAHFWSLLKRKQLDARS